jgi:hypothetical protein
MNPQRLGKPFLTGRTMIMDGSCHRLVVWEHRATAADALEPFRTSFDRLIGLAWATHGRRSRRRGVKGDVKGEVLPNIDDSFWCMY